MSLATPELKTKKKNSGLYLQKNSGRWKWMAGATAAGMTASQAGAITITLANNYISALGGNHLNTDLTGDGHPDLTISNAVYYARFSTSGNVLPPAYVRAHLNGILAEATYSTGRNLRLGTHSITSVSGPHYLTGSIPILFKDLHINGGAPTSGLLQVTVSTLDAAEIQLDSFTYTSSTPVQGSSRTVPDQGSSLALLAMGAGGIFALRRWRTAQRHS